ncbi:MAG TPA: alginate export family protein [Vicinamibacterales bacterium]|nr:alginate export family protein [Vicinamibacterales bacterium]
MSGRRVPSYALSILFALASAASAQTRAPAPPPPPQGLKVGDVDVTIGWRSRAEVWNWFEGSAGNSDYAFGHSQLRIGVGQKRTQADWFVELEQPTIFALPNDTVAPAPLGQLGLGGTYYVANGNSENNAYLFLKQAYVQLKRLGPNNVRLGRFEFFDGVEARSSDPLVTNIVQTRIAHRLISNFGFTAVQRTFDGGQYQWNSGSHNITAFGGRPTEGIFQVNGMKEVDVQTYYGAYNESVKTENGAGSLRVFGIGYIDTRSTVLKTDNRPTAIRTADQNDVKLGTWGADYVHVFHTKDAGTWDVLGWGVVQTGAWGTLRQRAGAFVAEAGWQSASSALKPWISGGYSFGSGDSNPNDSTNGTFFQLLTTPRQYARFPFYNMMNNEDAYVTLNVRPVPKLAVRSELHALSLADAADLWYSGGGVFQESTFGFSGRPSNGHTDLGTVWDISGDYPLTRSFTLSVYYACASGGSVINSIYSRNQNGQFGYVETTVHF